MTPEFMARGVPTHVAAKIMGKTEDRLRWAMRENRVNLGWCVQGNSGHWTYWISPKLLSEMTGISVENIHQMSDEWRKFQKEARNARKN